MQALALCQEMGNRHGEAICLRHLGRVHHLHGDHHEALSALDKSLTLCLRRDDAEGQAQCHESMAGVHLDLGDVRLAVQHLEESLALYTNCQVASRAMPTAAGESGEDGETGALEGIAGRLVGGEDEGDLIAAAGGGMQAEVQPGGGERAEQEEKGGKEESDVQRVSNKLQGARTLIKQANVAYEDYDQALRRAQAGAGAVPPAGESGGDDGGVDLGTAHRKPLLIDVIRGKKGEAGSEPAGMGGDVVLAPSGREHSKGKGGGPKFPLKFKMKVPGQDMSSHFKFLQSWTVHRKYYQTSDEADPTDPQASERADRA
jgi:tetratricopeptide (TPR) repeat protein